MDGWFVDEVVRILPHQEHHMLTSYVFLQTFSEMIFLTEEIISNADSKCDVQ